MSLKIFSPVGNHVSECYARTCQVVYSQFGLAIHQNDHQARRRFVEWAQNEIAVVPDFHKRILFSDEAHFWLNGYVNKQNCCIWSEANPQVYVETPLHPEKLTIWCALWAARATIDLLKDTFGDRLISRFGPVNWPPRSCDLIPLDYFLWGYVKSLVYADKAQTLDHLEDNIRRVIADIRPQMLEKVIENWTSRLDYIRASHGSPMTEIIFKIVTVYHKQWHLIPSHQLWERCVAESEGRIETFTTGPPHMNSIVINAQIESKFVAEDHGSIPSQSNPVVRDTTPNEGIDGWVSSVAHVTGAAIPDVLQPGTS
ncbi:uncharacterized protein TNCV_1187801 [Trichonephila clavipes]|nr:uncharacterized protein TNCV_1187801 [Trichonephila clavipes]